MKTKDFIKSAHYFGRCSMGNFWNTFEENRVVSDFNKISEDGFNAIVLIIPWAQFQQKIKPVSFDEVTINRLRFLLQKAKEFNLKVILRLGYLWENTKLPVSTYQRYQQFFSDPDITEAWVIFVSEIKKIAEQEHNNIIFMLCWEDPYWPVLRGASDAEKEVKIKLSQELGFTQFLKNRFDINSLNIIFNINIQSFEDIEIPTIKDALFSEFVAFFDREYVEKWIIITVATLGKEICYEHKIDPIEIQNTITPFAVECNNYKSGVKVDAIYYHPKIGVQESSVMNASDAAFHLEKTLSGFKQNNIHRLPLFMDQFNFKVHNPRYPGFKRIPDHEVIEFLKLCPKIFKRYLSGYGVWGYFDWCDDKIFNGAFELGSEGWILEGNANFLSYKDKNAVSLRTDGHISQSVPEVNSTPKCYIEFVDLKSIAKIKISNGIESQEYTLRPGDNEKIFDLNTIGNVIKITCIKGDIQLNKLAYYTHIFSNGVRDIKGGATSFSNNIAILNHSLN